MRHNVRRQILAYLREAHAPGQASAAYPPPRIPVSTDRTALSGPDWQNRQPLLPLLGNKDSYCPLTARLDRCYRPALVRPGGSLAPSPSRQLPGGTFLLCRGHGRLACPRKPRLPDASVGSPCSPAGCCVRLVRRAISALRTSGPYSIAIPSAPADGPRPYISAPVGRCSSKRCCRL